jgi:hypothetical protein
MVKSMQTSGGTCLSTNWGEVEKSNYEKERQAPKGMEWKDCKGNKLLMKEDNQDSMRAEGWENRVFVDGIKFLCVGLLEMRTDWIFYVRVGKECPQEMWKDGVEGTGGVLQRSTKSNRKG